MENIKIAKQFIEKHSSVRISDNEDIKTVTITLLQVMGATLKNRAKDTWPTNLTEAKARGDQHGKTGEFDNALAAYLEIAKNIK
jgi:hypothetical protein